MVNVSRFLKGEDNILKKGLLSASIKVLGAFASYILSFLIAKKYGAEGNGVLALFMTYLMILSTVFYLGLDTFLVKEISSLMREKEYSKIEKLYLKIVKTYLLPISACLVCIGILMYLYFDQLFYLFIALALIQNVLIDINCAMFRGMKKAELYSFFMQFSKHFFPIILLLLPLFSANNTDNVLIIYISGLLLNVLLTTVILNKIFRKNKLSYKIEYTADFSLGKIFKTSKEYFFSSIVIISLVWVDFLFVDYFLEEKDAGIYSVALKIATLVSFGFTAFNIFLAPKISEIHVEGNKIELQRLLTKNFIFVFPMLLVPFLIVLIFNTHLLKIFGMEFQSGYIVLLLLSSAQFINGVVGPVSILLQMTGNQRVFQNILFITLLVKITSALLFVRLWGINGIALASFIALSFWTILGSYFVFKRLQVYSWFSISDLKLYLSKVSY